MHHLGRHALILICSLALVFSGCGSGDDLVDVSGIVTIDGKPLTHGHIILIPENGRPAGGDIGRNGRFTLKPFNEQEGCPLGTHKVEVHAVEVLTPSRQKWHAPKHYRHAETSGLTATIDKSTDSLKIELTWAGGKPFIEGTGATGDKE